MKYYPKRFRWNVLFFVISIFLSMYVNPTHAQMIKSKAEQYFEKADGYFDKKEFEKAIIYYDSCILTNTEYVEAYAYRGVCKFELKRFQESIEDFDLAIILESGYAEVYYYRGLAKKELGFNEKACSDWIIAYNLGLKMTLNLIKQNCEKEFKKEIMDKNKGKT